MFFILYFFVKWKTGGRGNLDVVDRPVIFAANHSSYIDPLLLPMFLPFKLLPVRFMANMRFFRQPFGILLWLLGSYPARRGNKDIQQSLIKPEKIIERGQHIGIFPEGRISRSGGTQKAYRGIACLAKDTGAAVIPVAIYGSYKISKRIKLFRPRPVIKIYYGPPMIPLAEESAQDFAARVIYLIREYLAIIG